MQPEPTDAEVAQQVERAWAGLLSAAGQFGYAVDELVRPPASARQVADAEQAIGRPLPRDLAFLYQQSDGQVDWIDLVRGPDEDRRRVLAPSVRALLRLCADRMGDPGPMRDAADGVALYPLER